MLILNPGILPEPLNMEQLKVNHPSVLRNSRIATMFFYAGLIEQWGSGTLKIVRECEKMGLPEPKFEENIGFFWLTLSKEWLTEERLSALSFNERQIRAVHHVKEKGRITNREYQELNRISKPTATRDLTGLVAKGVFRMAGGGKRDAHYCCWA